MILPTAKFFIRCNTFSFIFIPLLLIFLLHTAVLSPLNSAAQQVQINPEEIKISVSENNLQQIKDTQIYLSPVKVNVTNIKVLSTDLRSDQENWIENSKIKVTPQTISLISGHVANLTLNFEGLQDSKPGIYSGNLFLSSPALTTIKIPLTISIHSDAIIALSLVALGVISNFLLKFFQLKVKDKEANRQSLDATITKHNQIVQLKNIFPKTGVTLLHLPNSLTKVAEDELKKSIDLYNNGHFRESMTAAKNSSETLGSVMLGPEQPALSAAIPVSSLKLRPFWFLTRPSRGDYAAYAGLTLGLLISVLLVWQEYFSKLSVFGIFPIDYISAFLFGFGSQAILLSEILDFAKKVNH